MKNVLVACEESQEVCKAFREKGFNAFSCDIIDCSGGKPEWHIKHDCISIMNSNTFITVDGEEHFIDKWDLIIAHPPCTYLCTIGQPWCNAEKYGIKAIERIKKRESAIDFFMQFVNYANEHRDCKVAIENPIGIMSTIYKKATQVIHPCWFGEDSYKSTCLWLFGLDPLKPTNKVEVTYHITKNGKKFENWWFKTSFISNLTERSKIRSKTFPNVAKAMAEQWGKLL